MWDGFFVGWGWGYSCRTPYSDDFLNWWDAYLFRERLKGESKPKSKSLVCTAYPKWVGRKPAPDPGVDIRLCRSGYRRTCGTRLLDARAGGTQTAPGGHKSRWKKNPKTAVSINTCRDKGANECE